MQSVMESTVAAECCSPAVELTRKHLSRLRFYWQSRRHHSAGQRDAVDLELIALGLIEVHSSAYQSSVTITQAGAQRLAGYLEENRERNAPHHHLGERLGQWLVNAGRAVWVNTAFMVGDRPGRQNIRPDVFSVKATLNGGEIDAVVHEVKISRADFFADVARPEKRQGYWRMAERVFYVVPAGLVSPDEVPDGCGLVVECGVGDFRVAKRAVRRKLTLPAEVFMNMVLKPHRVRGLGSEELVLGKVSNGALEFKASCTPLAEHESPPSDASASQPLGGPK